jgi:hypothetical protein
MGSILRNQGFVILTTLCPASALGEFGTEQLSGAMGVDVWFLSCMRSSETSLAMSTRVGKTDECI